jgi:hypothetical protein
MEVTFQALSAEWRGVVSFTLQFIYLLKKESSVPLDIVVVYLTTPFQYLRLYSVDFYSVLFRLPSSSEAGETRVRNMAAEFCRRASIVLVGFFNMP